jgi:hypothetical protein
MYAALCGHSIGKFPILACENSDQDVHSFWSLPFPNLRYTTLVDSREQEYPTRQDDFKGDIFPTPSLSF